MQRKQPVGKLTQPNYYDEDHTWSHAKFSQFDRGMEETLPNAPDFGSMIHSEQRYHDTSYMFDPDQQIQATFSNAYAPVLGADPRRMFPSHTYLPVNQPSSDMNTAFVNPKQYEAIMRLRMNRMKRQNKKGRMMGSSAKLKQTFKYESRSNHAKKRSRASNGKFLKGKVTDETSTKFTGDHGYDDDEREEPCNADQVPAGNGQRRQVGLGKRDPAFQDEEEGMQESRPAIRPKLEENVIPLPKLEDQDDESDDQLFEADRNAMAIRGALDPDEESLLPLGRHDSMMDRPRNR